MTPPRIGSLILWAGWAFGLAAAPPPGGDSDRFAPTHRLSCIGVDRREMSGELLAKRTELMIKSHTFGILRDPRSTVGAERIFSPKLQKIFADAERRSGLPASLISAIAFLESFGDPTAQSPTGPKGIMQISAGTARAMGLQIVYSTRYKVTSERVQVKTKRGKLVSKVVKKRTPYTVLVRDERLMPERAIPAAASYLARLETRYGGRDWAVFAYHCGEGCVNSMMELTRHAEGVQAPYTVAKMFFAADPSHNRELYRAIESEMDRDYSPTYWFRIMRAEQLLKLYHEDPLEYRSQASQYRYELDPARRAPHRLSVWLTSADLRFQNGDDLKREQGKALVRVFDDEDYFGFRLRKDQIGATDPGNREFYLQATPSAAGTLAYIAFETRRLHEAMKPRGETFAPLEVVSLVQPAESFRQAARQPGHDESFWHCTGQVFDIDTRNLPPGEREALDFVLHDMGWMGYLGFVEEGRGTWHIGASPASRDFFLEVFADAMAAKKGQVATE